jgi:hypothetical protein
MANIPKHQGRAAPKLGPSDLSDTASDRPGEPATDSDAGGTGERVTVGKVPYSELHPAEGTDRIVDSQEAGLGGGLDQAEEARLGRTDEEIEEEARNKARRLKTPKP